MKPGIIAYQADDFTISDAERRPNLPQFQSSHDEFYIPHDIPLNRRHFMYVPCAPIAEFKELGYCNTEYPFDNPGFSYMDRSSGIALHQKKNETIGVPKIVGWRTARCDVCIKEGLSYWEVEILKGGSVDSESSDNKRKKELIDSSPHLRFGISRREASLEAPVGFDSYGYGIRDQSLESIFDGNLKQLLQPIKELKPGDILGFLLRLPDIDTQVKQAKEYTNRRLEALNKSNANHVDYSEDLNGGPPKKKNKLEKTTQKDFQRALLEDIDYNNIIRDQIAIRYKNQLFFEATDYVKTTKPEYYSSDRRERQDYYTLEGSYLKLYLNGKLLGTAFDDLKPFLPPFSELQYNEKFYFGYWKHGEYNDENIEKEKSSIQNGTEKKGLLLRNKYVNNNKLGYYPTVSCFNGGEARIITAKSKLKYFNNITEHANTLDILFKEQVAEDIVWDIIDEVEEEFKETSSISSNAILDLVPSITSSNGNDNINVLTRSR